MLGSSASCVRQNTSNANCIRAARYRRSRKVAQVLDQERLVQPPRRYQAPFPSRQPGHTQPKSQAQVTCRHVRHPSDSLFWFLRKPKVGPGLANLRYDSPRDFTRSLFTAFSVENDCRRAGTTPRRNCSIRFHPQDSRKLKFEKKLKQFIKCVSLRLRVQMPDAQAEKYVWLRERRGTARCGALHLTVVSSVSAVPQAIALACAVLHVLLHVHP